VLAIDGRGDTVVIGTGHTASPPAAAVLNGTFVSGFRTRRLPPHRAGAQLPLVIPALLSRRRPLPTTVSPRAAGRDRGFEVGPRVGYTLHAPECSTAVAFGSVFAPTPRRWRRASSCPSPGQLEDALGWPRPSRQA